MVSNYTFLLIRKIYLYIVVLIGIVLVVIGSVRLVDIGLKTYIFTRAEQWPVYPPARRIVPLTEENGQEVNYQEPSPEEQAEYTRAQSITRRQGEAAGSLAMVIIGLPLYLYHWSILKKEQG
jgi:hypothetical protein